MTDEKIISLAREYSQHNNYPFEDMTEAKLAAMDVIKWLSQTHCIVEKSKVIDIEEYDGVMLQWCEEFFDPSGVNLNKRLPKKDLWLAFSEYAGGSNAHGVTRTNFKKILQAFCKLKGYDFNNHRPITLSPGNHIRYSDWKKAHPTETYIGDDDKANGVEYFTVFSLDKDKDLKSE